MFFTQCSSPPSTLPGAMPRDIEMSYETNGDHYQSRTSIAIKNDSLFYVEIKSDTTTGARWQAAITHTEEENVYQSFRKNKIDLVENKGNLVTVKWEGAGSQDLYLRFNYKNFHVGYGANTPLSRREINNFTAVAEEINALKKKYEAGH